MGNFIIDVLGIKDGSGYCRNVLALEKPVVTFTTIFYNEMKNSINIGFNQSIAGFQEKSCKTYTPASKLQAFLLLLISIYVQVRDRDFRVLNFLPDDKVKEEVIKIPGFDSKKQLDLFNKYNLLCVINCLVCEGVPRNKILNAISAFGLDTNLLMPNTVVPEDEQEEEDMTCCKQLTKVFSVPTNTWTMVHGLNKYVNYKAINNEGILISDVSETVYYPNQNTITIVFGSEKSGTLVVD